MGAALKKRRIVQLLDKSDQKQACSGLFLVPMRADILRILIPFITKIDELMIERYLDIAHHDFLHISMLSEFPRIALPWKKGRLTSRHINPPSSSVLPIQP